MVVDDNDDDDDDDDDTKKIPLSFIPSTHLPSYPFKQLLILQIFAGLPYMTEFEVHRKMPHVLKKPIIIEVTAN